MVPFIAAVAPFCLVDKSLTPLDIRAENLPEELHLRFGPSALPPDSYAWRARRFIIRRFAARCLRPVHLKADTRPDADIDLHWVRRSRVGGDDFNAVDVPLGETRERYRVRVSVGQKIFYETETKSPAWRYPRALQSAHVAQMGDDLPATIRLGVAQMSAEFGAGPEAELYLTPTADGKYDTKRNT